jgi:hypothetical protein
MRLPMGPVVGDRGAASDPQGEGGRARPAGEELARDRPGTDGVDAGVAVSEVAFASDEHAVEVELIGGVGGDLNNGPRDGAERGEARVAASLEVRLRRFGGPGGVRLPAGFIESGRRPCRVVAGAPDALAWRDRDERLRAQRSRQKKGHECKRSKDLWHAQLLRG